MKAAVKTLGCKVNQYESEMIKERFSQAGYEIVSEEERADVYIINTCTVTHLADRKSRQYIRKMKKISPESLVVVTGCYAQVSPEEVAAIEEVDIVTGSNQKSDLPKLVSEYRSRESSLCMTTVQPYEALDTYRETGIITSMEGRTRAFVKIQEGCNRFCSYCIIPYARGRVRSRNPEDIIHEVSSLLERGFKEIVLTGINTALYAMEDMNQEKIQKAEADNRPYGIEMILDRLEAMPGDFRVRLSSLEPTVINREYVKRLMKYQRLCPHLHLSVQSGSDRVLKLMNRRYDRAEYLEIVKVLKEKDPSYGITTDIIAGFPGEKEEDFQDSLKIIEEVGFCKVHAFNYSKRKGTPAASMKDQVNPQVKNRRVKELIEAGNQASLAFFKKSLGERRRVLLEEEVVIQGERYATGYTENYIKAYLPVSQLENRDFTGSFVDVCVGQPFSAGVLCSII